MEERIEALCTQLKQVQGTKTRLEHQMDNLDVTDTHYNKKISDLQRRYDEQYDKAETIETQMDEWNSRLLSVRQEIKNLPLESESTVENCVLLERVRNRKADSYVKLNVKMADYYRIKDLKGGEADG